MFDADLAESFRDARLCAFFEPKGARPGFLSLDDSGPFSPLTASVIARLTNVAQARYTSPYGRQRKLRAIALNRSHSRNAWAIWTNCDWVVVTTGLIEQLANYAKQFSDWVKESDYLDWPEEMRLLQGLAFKRARSLPAAGDGLTEVLYSAAVSFFFGHEVGHHVQGHDAFYGTRKIPAVDEAQASKFGTLDQHALELDADRCGIAWAVQIALDVVSDYAEMSDDPAKHAMGKAQLAHVVAAGAFLATIALDPRSEGVESSRDKTHPPSSMRALWQVNEIEICLSRVFNFTQADQREHLRGLVNHQLLMALMLLKRTADEKTPISPYVAYRRSGVRRAAFDPNLKSYLEELRSAHTALQPDLDARRRY